MGTSRSFGFIAEMSLSLVYSGPNVTLADVRVFFSIVGKWLWQNFLRCRQHNICFVIEHMFYVKVG